MDKRRKEVAFLAIAVVVLGLAVVLQLRSGATPSPAAAAPGSQAAAAKPSAAPAHPAPPGQATAQVAATPASAPSGLAAVSVPPPKSTRDPFSALAAPPAPSRKGVEVAQLPNVPVSRPLFPPLRLNSVPPVTPFRVGPASALGTPPMAGGPGPSQPSAPPQPAQPRLVGIVEGDQPMAVIRLGDKRYYPRLGESIGEYAVSDISARRVVLSSASGTLSLSLGGR